jgi:hexosaminidase
MVRPLGLILAAAVGLAATTARGQTPVSVNIVPAPLSAMAPAQPAQPVRISDGTPILAPPGDTQALRTARWLSAMAARTRGLTLPVGGAVRPGQPAIRLLRAQAPTGEAYSLEIGQDGVTIASAGDAGLFHGAVSLWQLLTPDAGRGPVALAPVRVDDAPRFAWRGLMLDSARHFQSPAEIEKIIDGMAALKLNVLHWHLTDDQGWRLEVPKYPRLTSVGAWRTPPFGSPDRQAPAKGKAPARYGGFYTRADVRRIVVYAAERQITIVPEIEMPGHATSALLAYPQFGEGAKPEVADQTRWGGFPYVYGVGDPSFRFLEDVLTEVMDLFPGRYIHVGGDEAERERWNASPAAQARLKALGTTDPAALQAYFTHRIADFLKAHGRTLVGWDEILLGGDLPGDAVVTSWHGVQGGLDAAAKGHDAVMAPAPVFYFDNRQGLGAEEPPGRGWLVRLRDVYAFEAAPATLTPQVAGHILGVQGNLWTEHVRTAADVEAMLFPRAAAIAEDGWTQAARKDWPGFLRRTPAQIARFGALGLTPDAAALSIAIAPAFTTQGPAAVLSNQSGEGQIRFTTDGSQPTPASALYAQPIPAKGPLHVRAALYFDDVRIGPVAERTIDAVALRTRASQDLALCNEKLALNLEGAAGPIRRTYLINPADPCWILAGADVTGVTRVTVSFERLPFNLGLDPGHDSVIVHPPRTPAGELEVREDGCLTDPVAVAAVPPGPAGARTELTLSLPPRTGRHDLCFSFTGRSFDPVMALSRVTLGPP